MPPELPVTAAAIQAAAARLTGRIVTTPLLSSPALDAEIGARVFVKAEPLQRTGSFKVRGAFNKILQIPEADRARGLIAYSSGNHAQAVACAARELGCLAVIVMPQDAPRVKVEQTRFFGAEVVFYDRRTESREAVADGIRVERKLTLIRPYDDPDIIAGQGTVGLEIAAQMRDMDLVPDLLLVPCGGGGLIAGTATAALDAFPSLQVMSVEPVGFDDTARSLSSGVRQSNDPAAASICDALLAPTPGEITFEVNRRLLSAGLSVPDDAVCAAMRAAFRHLKLVVEPGGAVALAALLSGACETEGKTVVAVASGGNVDAGRYAEILTGEDEG